MLKNKCDCLTSVWLNDQKKCLFLHSVCTNFCLNTHYVGANFGLIVHSPVYSVILLKKENVCAPLVSVLNCTHSQWKAVTAAAVKQL